VPVIPVIAKADCMTIEERQSFRNHINASLEKPNYSSGILLTQPPSVL